MDLRHRHRLQERSHCRTWRVRGALMRVSPVAPYHFRCWCGEDFDPHAPSGADYTWDRRKGRSENLIAGWRFLFIAKTGAQSRTPDMLSGAGGARSASPAQSKHPYPQDDAHGDLSRLAALPHRLGAAPGRLPRNRRLAREVQPV